MIINLSQDQPAHVFSIQGLEFGISGLCVLCERTYGHTDVASKRVMNRMLMVSTENNKWSVRMTVMVIVTVITKNVPFVSVNLK